MTYVDRFDAGRALVEAFPAEVHLDASALILGVARGGVPVAAEVAAAFGAELDVAIARKIGAPGNPEFAIGAVAEGGAGLIDDAAVVALRIDDAYVREATQRALEEVRRRGRRYRGGRPPAEITHRTVVVVDDGVATGSTLIAVLRSVRAGNPARLVCAVPVGPPDTIERLRSEADVVVCPLQPRSFRAVGLWYDDFRQLSDEDVISYLAKSGS